MLKVLLPQKREIDSETGKKIPHKIRWKLLGYIILAYVALNVIVYTVT